MTLFATLPLSPQLGLKEAFTGTTAVKRQDLLMVMLSCISELPQPNKPVRTRLETCGAGDIQCLHHQP